MNRVDRLNKLLDKWDACQRCGLYKERTRVVRWRGNPYARLMAIGEGPGGDEDKHPQGWPFVGMAGQKEDRLLRGAGVCPEKGVFIVNLVGCRPPGNRVPTRDEIKACSPRLENIIELIQPRVLLLLGATAVKRLTGAAPITKWRGHVLVADFWLPNKGAHEIPAVATFHPSYLLRQGDPPDLRKLMIEDRRMAKGLAGG